MKSGNHWQRHDRGSASAWSVGAQPECIAKNLLDRQPPGSNALRSRVALKQRCSGIGPQAGDVVQLDAGAVGLDAVSAQSQEGARQVLRAAPEP